MIRMRSLGWIAWMVSSPSTDHCMPKPSHKKYKRRSRFSWEMKSPPTILPSPQYIKWRLYPRKSAEIHSDFLSDFSRCESEMIVYLLVRGRHAELIDTQGQSLATHPFVPARCGSRFDGYPVGHLC